MGETAKGKTSPLAVLKGGSAVLFRNSSIVLLVLVASAFLAVLPTSALGQTVPLKTYWHGGRNDNFTTATTVGEQSALGAGYQFIRIEGFVFPNQQPGTVPLKLFWSGARNDNFTTATAVGEQSALGAGYQFIRIEGYVFSTQQPGTVPLKLFWNGARNDNFTTATPEGERSALAAGYQFIRIEGYIFSSPQPGPAPQVGTPLSPAKPGPRPGFPGIGVQPVPVQPAAPAPQQPGIPLPGRRPPIPVQPVEPDNRPPGPAPTNITPTAPGPTTVQLQWGVVANAVGYLVQRGNETVTTSPITATSYTDGGRTPKTTYSYTVAAVYPATGQYSPGWSGPVSVVTPPALPPTDLKATVTGPSTVVVSWSPRAGAVAYILSRNGTRARLSTTTFTDQGLAPGTYVYSVAAIHRVEAVGEVIGEWSDALVLAPRPLNMLVVGDSIMWGQGLSQASKFSTRVKQWLEGRLNGRSVNLMHLAQSGAVIGDVANPVAGSEPRRGEVPNHFPTIAYQANPLPSSKGMQADDVDFVLLDGGINDVGVINILHPLHTPLWIRDHTQRECVQGMKDLLTRAVDENWFPRAKIIVTSYYPIISPASGLQEVNALLGGLGLLGFLPPPVEPAGILTNLVVTAGVRTNLAAQSATFYQVSTEGFRQIIDDMNSSSNMSRFRFVNVVFRPENSYGAHDTWLWRIGEHDEVWDQRQRDCANSGSGGDPLCLDAAMGHPNLAGARTYTDAVTRELEPFVTEWANQWRVGATASLPPPPPLYVLSEFSQRTPTSATMTVYAADWPSGAGVEGRVKLDGVDKGPLGTPITFALKPQPPGRQRNSIYGGLVPPSAAVAIAGRQDTPFSVRPPILRMKLQVTKGAPISEGQETIKVDALEVGSNQRVQGAVLINGEKVGDTGAFVPYSCYEPSAVEVQPEIETTPGGKPKIVRPPASAVRALRCAGVVQATGYLDARFKP